jgi:hypothetical protein
MNLMKIQTLNQKKKEITKNDKIFISIDNRISIEDIEFIKSESGENTTFRTISKARSKVSREKNEI